VSIRGSVVVWGKEPVKRREGGWGDA